MARKKVYEDPYSEATIKKKRRFPVLNSILLGLLVILQICLILLAFFGE